MLALLALSAVLLALSVALLALSVALLALSVALLALSVATMPTSRPVGRSAGLAVIIVPYMRFIRDWRSNLHPKSTVSSLPNLQCKLLAITNTTHQTTSSVTERNMAKKISGIDSSEFNRSPRYTCYSVKLDIRSMTLLTGTMAESTCSPALREEYPTVYIGAWHGDDVTRRKMHIPSFDMAVDIARHINSKLALISDVLRNLAEWDVEEILSQMFYESFGFWSTKVDPMTKMADPPSGKVKPIPRKAKFKRAARHLTADIAAKNEERQRAGKPIHSEPHQVIDYKTAPPDIAIGSARHYEHEHETSFGTSRQPWPTSKNATVEKTVTPPVQPKPKPKRFSKAHQSQILAIVSSDMAATICRHVNLKYGIKLVTLEVGNVTSISSALSTSSTPRQEALYYYPDKQTKIDGKALSQAKKYVNRQLAKQPVA